MRERYGSGALRLFELVKLPEDSQRPLVSVQLGQRFGIGSGFWIVLNNAFDCLVECHQQ
jgi:hypothetical protein